MTLQVSFFDQMKTTICATRYGNVMASRGSIPLFVDQILAGKSLTITDPNGPLYDDFVGGRFSFVCVSAW